MFDDGETGPLNPYRAENPKLQVFFDRWFREFPKATLEQKDALVMAFIAYVMGMGKETALRFAAGESSAYREIMKKIEMEVELGGTPDYNARMDFWNKVATVFPEHYYTAKEIHYLTNAGMKPIEYFF